MVWQLDMVSYVFWLLASMNVALLLRMWTASNPGLGRRASHSALAAGQRKDNWLLAVILACAFWFDRAELADLAMLLALPVMVWLIQRAKQRLRLLERMRS